MKPVDLANYLQIKNIFTADLLADCEGVATIYNKVLSEHRQRQLDKVRNKGKS